MLSTPMSLQGCDIDVDCVNSHLAYKLYDSTMSTVLCYIVQIYGKRRQDKVM